MCRLRAHVAVTRPMLNEWAVAIFRSEGSVREHDEWILLVDRARLCGVGHSYRQWFAAAYDHLAVDVYAFDPHRVLARILVCSLVGDGFVMVLVELGHGVKEAIAPPL